MNEADKQLAQRIALAFMNLENEELAMLADLAPNLRKISIDMADWIVSLCDGEAARRAGQQVYFPFAPFVDSSDAVVGGALAEALLLMESATSERLHDAAFALMYFTACTANVRLVARTITLSN